MEIEYRIGDATAPEGAGPKIIAHIVNDRGRWGKGFVVAISRRWPAPEADYRAWHREQVDFALGETQLVQVEPEVWVANMIAQHGMGVANGIPPIRYDALRSCLEKLAARAAEMGASVHMPRIGCGLAGGEWSEVAPIIADTLSARGIAVTVYDFA